MAKEMNPPAMSARDAGSTARISPGLAGRGTGRGAPGSMRCTVSPHSVHWTCDSPSRSRMGALQWGQGITVVVMGTIVLAGEHTSPTVAALHPVVAMALVACPASSRSHRRAPRSSLVRPRCNPPDPPPFEGSSG